MRTSVLICVISFVTLLWILRRGKTSVGLPVAYLANLLILHVPGAIAQALDKSGALSPYPYTRLGIIITAVGSVAFVGGVIVSRMNARSVEPQPAARTLFWKYCVLAGGLCTVVGYLVQLPSITAVLSRGGFIWVLGVMLALRSTLGRDERAKSVRWFFVLAAYPVLMLLLGGFLSYGASVVIIVLSGVAISTRSPMKLAGWSLVLLVVGTSLFLSYFEHRPEIRAAVWNGGDTDARIDATVNALKDIKPFNPGDATQLFALDQRLNQNYYVGLAESRIRVGQVNYLYGRSIWEGLQALVPRALWPEKPVVAGSPKIVSEMTGLTFAEGTSIGVGNVMEFDINFGIPGVVVGFVLLGFALGRLDLRVAERDIEGGLGETFIYFLPAVALIQPNGSIVELMSGSASAVAAAIAWKWAWQRWPKPVAHRGTGMVKHPNPLPT